MVPQGLVLLTSMAFAVGALRLARHRVLVQELAAVEGLARVDVLCIDKTGTLTEPGLRLAAIEVLSDVPRPEVEHVLAAVAAADPAPNATIGALALLGAGESTGWRVRSQVPFSSSRKWSAVSFVDRGSWVLGAPQVILPEDESDVMARSRNYERSARRVLVLARAPEPVEGGSLPPTLEPVALIVLAEQVRPDAAATVRYLLEQGMTIKVLSGDAPETVAQVADRLGIESPGAAQDAGSIDDDSALRSALDATNLLGRIRPEQKLAVVNILQAQGHVVAMVGDGVNDVQALKQADIGIAMGSGSQSSRSVARVVLLDSAFSAVPRILAEGRKVIANIERVANLFITKTVYAALLAAAIVVGAEPYPFFPRHLTIVDTLTIGVPGFFLAFESASPARQAWLHPPCTAFHHPSRYRHRCRHIRQLPGGACLARHQPRPGQDGGVVGRVRHGHVGLDPDRPSVQPRTGDPRGLHGGGLRGVVLRLAVPPGVCSRLAPERGDRRDRLHRRGRDRRSHALAPHRDPRSGS